MLSNVWGLEPIKVIDIAKIFLYADIILFLLHMSTQPLLSPSSTWKII